MFEEIPDSPRFGRINQPRDLSTVSLVTESPLPSSDLFPKSSSEGTIKLSEQKKAYIQALDFDNDADVSAFLRMTNPAMGNASGASGGKPRKRELFVRPRGERRGGRLGRELDAELVKAQQKAGKVLLVVWVVLGLCACAVCIWAFTQV